MGERAGHEILMKGYYSWTPRSENPKKVYRIVGVLEASTRQT
jgi:hypothetical protein